MGTPAGDDTRRRERRRPLPPALLRRHRDAGAAVRRRHRPATRCGSPPPCWPAAFVALAALAASTWARSRWPYVGIAVACTPVAIYSSSIAAPNGVEMMSALALWMSLIGLALGATRARPTRLAVIAAVVGRHAGDPATAGPAVVPAGARRRAARHPTRPGAHPARLLRRPVVWAGGGPGAAQRPAEHRLGRWPSTPSSWASSRRWRPRSATELWIAAHPVPGLDPPGHRRVPAPQRRQPPGGVRLLPDPVRRRRRPRAPRRLPCGPASSIAPGRGHGAAVPLHHHRAVLRPVPRRVAGTLRPAAVDRSRPARRDGARPLWTTTCAGPVRLLLFLLFVVAQTLGIAYSLQLAVRHESAGRLRGVDPAIPAADSGRGRRSAQRCCGGAPSGCRGSAET